jgi:hypothetical protein
MKQEQNQMPLSLLWLGLLYLCRAFYGVWEGNGVDITYEPILLWSSMAHE